MPVAGIDPAVSFERGTMNCLHNSRRTLHATFFGVLSLSSIVAVTAAGCQDRPIAPAKPTVSARFVGQAKQEKMTKIDLLFMIDNSSSIADKQQILAETVPDLVTRLVDPVCIDPITQQQINTRHPDG